MACYLTFAGRGSECAGCSRTIRHALVGWTDDLDPGKLQPVCRACLDGLDPKLRQVQVAMAEASAKWLDEL